MPFASDSGCPTAGDLASLRQEISIDFEREKDPSDIVCPPSVSGEPLSRQQKRVLSALGHMRRLRFDAPLPWTTQTLYDWFRGTIVGIRVRADIEYPFCCEPPGVINLKYAVEPYDDDTVPVLPLRVLIHEARHVEVGPHTCGTTRDMRIADLGAFGVDYHLLLYLASRETSGLVGPEYQQYARVSADNVRTMGFCFECARQSAESRSRPSRTRLLLADASLGSEACDP